MIVQQNFEHLDRRWLVLMEANKIRSEGIPQWDLTLSVREWIRRGRKDVLLAFGQGEWDIETSRIVKFELVDPDLVEVDGLVEAASRVIAANDFDNAEWLLDWRMRPPGADGSIGLEVDVDRLPRAVRLRLCPLVTSRERERAYA